MRTVSSHYFLKFSLQNINNHNNIRDKFWDVQDYNINHTYVCRIYMWYFSFFYCVSRRRSHRNHLSFIPHPRAPGLEIFRSSLISWEQDHANLHQYPIIRQAALETNAVPNAQFSREQQPSLHCNVEIHRQWLRTGPPHIGYRSQPLLVTNLHSEGLAQLS